MNKIAIVTGGSRGLGQSGVFALAEKGVDIIFTYHSNKQAAEQVVEQLQLMGRKAYALQLDTRDLDAFPAFVNEVTMLLNNEFKRNDFDYLVNNAGVGLSQSVLETTASDLQDMFSIHVMGPFMLTQSLFPFIKEQGHILNISSGLARFTLPGHAAYAMAKGAVEVMTRYMAKEFAAKQVRVNTLAPGAIATDFGGGAVRDNQDINSGIASVTALGRVGEAQDIGQAVRLLLSEDAGWITGQRIEASGGMFL
ncbi:SDR family oxidoreductase [Vibrio sp. S11_S32]|uniref:SDR family NAD(P)-dependent oxidoreductase n=1 Tax=Vibrio sp. S11_S32 TaxID=2720225 RepID=UPI00168014F5|nr:SDR family oxidoreductase [Vibrio sp. S11_S32]MBD1575915.1 SDR family oxidoreductase [Vibrio sp. S11_S32]